MDDVVPGLNDMLARWRTMPVGDRKAILKHLALPQRIALERALTRHSDLAPGHGASAAREFAAYSPWLADAVAGCLQDDARAAAITPATRAAICIAHRALAAERPANDAPSLWDVLRLRLRAWGLLP